MQEVPEQVLVAGLRGGDREALGRAYHQYKGDVVALAAAMLGRQDGAWDVLHDVFVSLARAGPTLAPDCRLKSYLLTAAANSARDALRRKSRRPAPEQVEAQVAPAGADPHLAAELGEEARRLWQIVARLPEEQRTVVALRIYADLTFREIAEREQISENTAQSRYRYALEKMRQGYRGERR